VRITGTGRLALDAELRALIELVRRVGANGQQS